MALRDQITLRISRSERQALERRAEVEGLSLGELVRRSLRESLQVNEKQKEVEHER